VSQLVSADKSVNQTWKNLIVSECEVGTAKGYSRPFAIAAALFAIAKRGGGDAGPRSL